MNIDYIELSIFVDKDTVYLIDLDRTGQNYGYDCYSLLWYKEIKIKFNPDTGHFIVKGSLPYFVDGHNFRNDVRRLRDGIQLISDMTNIDLNKAEVKCFEVGITFEIPFKPKQIFNSHYKITGMKPTTYPEGTTFNDRIKTVKIYNAGLRMKQALNKQERTRLAVEKGYNSASNYIRFELHYKKPAIHFKQRHVLLEDIFRSDFINKCKMDLFNTYQTIKKEGVFKLPDKKRDYTLVAIELLVLKEQAEKYGFNVEELMKSKIESIPDLIVNKEDKKNRKRSLNRLLKKIIDVKSSYYDLSDVLEKCLQFD